ncbi:MAG: OOP family OmpA-OmpF porin [Methylophilaceae bacterium]|jgi:OOP family OmpA-OmpF porin
MNKKLVGLAVAATLTLSAFSASAEDMYRGAWYAVPGVAYMDTDSDLNADNDTGAFIAIGKELSQSWDLQGRLGYNKADEDLGLNIGERGDYKSTQLGLDALYMFSRESFRPFLLAGLGATRNNVDYKVPGVRVSGEKTSWMASLGLGMQYFFSDKFGIQADLRRQFSRSKEGVNSLGAASNSKESVGNNLLSVGGIFRFGAPAPVVAAAAPVAAPVCVEKLDTLTIDAAKLFGFDKSALRAEGKAALDETAAKIKANIAITNVLVTGHTDRLGSNEYNQKLSERRAVQVAQYLASQGVNSDIVTSTGRGEAVPVVACEGVKGRKALIECLQPNRRVTVEAKTAEQVCN